jgi:NodT family efflux transporter outer membrane factor (OMF) lipoprotein
MRNRVLLALLPALLLAACDVAPPYEVPRSVAPAVAYRELGPWTPAAPADAAPRGRWWTVIADADLDRLEDRLEQASPRLAAALARYEQAAARASRARAALYPSLDAGVNVERSHYPEIPNHDLTLGGVAGYEVDLWGRVRNLVSAARSEASASAADTASVRLSLQAELAEDYLSLRGYDARIDVLRQTDEAYSAALKLTETRFDGGASSEIDVGRAKTQLADVQAQFEQATASRALLEHAIAILIGESPSSFTVPASSILIDAPHVPVDAPSILLERRPDIAAAERRVAEANAEVGVARAAYFPTVSLNAAGGLETLGGVSAASEGYWALGPLSVSLPVFDAGRRKAEVARARAAFDEAAADYRQTVLTAFQQVEDELVLANRLARAEARQQEAVSSAVETDRLANRRYMEGAADYLEVVTAQTAELQARQSDIQIRTERLVASIDLVRSLGGAWSAPAAAGSAPMRTSLGD